MVIRLNNATIKWGERVIIQDFSLSVSSGEIVFITGSNGRGKSTLIKAMAGLLPLYSGEIERPKRIAYVPQIEDADRDFPAKVKEIVITGRQRPGKLFYSRRDKELAGEKMQEMGISELAEQKLTNLSGGQLRRVFIARALCGLDDDPELLLLDEPCAGLDNQAHKILFDALKKLLARKCAVIMVTHDKSDTKLIPAEQKGRVINLD